MSQVDFVYALAADSVGLPLAVSVFSDRDLICRDMRDDVECAGLSLSNCSALALVQDHSPNTLGELILVDCPDEEPASLAALCSIDARAADRFRKFELARCSIWLLHGISAPDTHRQLTNRADDRPRPGDGRPAQFAVARNV